MTPLAARRHTRPMHSRGTVVMLRPTEVAVMKTMSSRDFNRDTAAAKRAAEDGPVIVTDRNRPAHVLMTWAEYRRLAGAGETAMDVIASADVADIELPVPQRRLPRDPSVDW